MEKISIAEFAERLGKPKAKVYSLLEKPEYKGFVSVVNGLKMVDVALLDVIQAEKPKAKVSNGVDAESQPKTAVEPEKPPHETGIDTDSTVIRQYTETIASLQEELKQAQAAIALKDAEIVRLSLELAEMAKNSQSITEKALNAVNQQQILTAIAAQKKVPWYKRLLGGNKEE